MRPNKTAVFVLAIAWCPWIQAAPWEPRLIATDPDGACTLNWAVDSRSVNIYPCDERQNLQWAWCALDASTGAITNLKPPAPLYELQSGDNEQREKSVAVFSKPLNRRAALQNTPWDSFGFDLDSLSYGWRFQDSRFSNDWKTVSIIAGGTIYTWVTSTGKLLNKVKLTAPQDTYNTYAFASFSRDGSYAVCSLDAGAKVSGAALFDAHSGRKILTIPGSQGVFFRAGFLQGNRLLVSHDRPPKSDQLMASIWSVQQKKKLWSTPSGGEHLLPRSNTVLITTDKAIEFRDLVTGKLQRKLPHPQKFMIDFAPSPDGSQIWASYGNGEIWGWHTE